MAAQTRVYKGIAYRQAQDPDAPLVITFVAMATDILEWVGIPRRSEKGLIGFQRLDDEPRVIRAKEFFTVPQNQSPTALIVGIHKPPTEAARKVRLELLGKPDPVCECQLHVTFDGAGLSDANIRTIISDQIQSRLTASDAKVAAQQEEEEEEESEEEGEGDADEQEENELGGDNQGEIELGRSLLNALLKNMVDETWFQANREALLDYARPATLIDGQHRIKGAQLCERPIPFTICALYDCPWPEQVFQFTVVNYTQSGIPDQFITANAALSLTSTELEQLEERLVQAKVKVIEYELMRVVNFDPASPFSDLINLTTKATPEKIGYKTMVRVAKSWFSGKNDAVRQLVAHIYPDIKGAKGKVVRDRIERWKDGDWGDFFIAFWSEVRSRYYSSSSHEPGRTLWEVGHSNLMIAAVLRELQEGFLSNLGVQDEEYFQTKTSDPKEELLNKVKDRAQKFLGYFPPEFFGMEWKQKSLNTGAGRTQLRESIEQFVNKKGSYKYANSALVTGKTAS